MKDKDIDTKLTEFLSNIEDKDLRERMHRRLKRNSHLITGAVLVNEDDKICLIQEAKEPYVGKWNLPIGHLECRETLPNEVKREVKEETGYDIELTALLPPQNVSAENVFRVLYVGKVIDGSPEERFHNDTLAVDWFSIAEIEKMLANQELRDVGAYYDILLYRNGPRLPINTIKEANYSKL